MKVTLIIWISAIILQEVEPGTLVKIPRDVANLQSSIHTEYEANYKQKGKHGNDSFSTIKGNQEILHDNCNDTWNEFAEKCAGLVKDLIASLANTISSSPGDATNLQLHIKNNFTHVDTSHKRNCFKRPPTCLSNLNFSSLFNNETGNILNQPDAVVPISVQTTLKKPGPCEQGSPTSLQQNDDGIVLNAPTEDPKRSQQGSSLDYVSGSHMNPEEAEALTGPQINNNRRQVNYPSSELVESENTVVRSEDSMTDPSTSSRLPVIPLNTEALSSNGEPHVAFDPNDMSLEISAVPSNPPFNIRNTSPNPYSVDRMDNSGNSFLDQSISNENISSRGPKALGVAGQSYPSSESSNEFFSNSVDRKHSIPPKYTSQQVSSEEEKYHTFLPPQSLVGEPLLGDSQQLHEELESEEKTTHKLLGHAHPEDNGHFLEKMPHPPNHHHPPLPIIVNEEPPVVPHHPFIAPTTASPQLLNPAFPPMLTPSQDPQSKEPSSPLLSADPTPDIPKTNASPQSIFHQDPLQELKHPNSNPPHPIESQPMVTEEPSPPILVPVSEPKKTLPEILPVQISNIEPSAKEISHDDYSNGNQPASPLESVPSPESTEPQILSFPQSPNKPLEASNHLSHHITEPVVSAGELVSSEDETSEKESPDDQPSPSGILLFPTPQPKEPIPHFHKPSSSLEQLEIVPPHDPHITHQHPPPHHHHHPHHHHPIAVDEDDKKSLPEIERIPIVETEEKPSSPKRELVHPHPSHPAIELVPVSPSEKELPPPPPPKVELVPLPPPEKELPPPPPKMELVPVPLPEKELPPPPPPPPKMELVPVIPLEEELPPPPPHHHKKELVPVHPIEKELPPPPPPKVELVPLPPPEKELPPPPPPKIELVPVLPPEKELPPPPPPPKIELVPVPPLEEELPPPPPHHHEKEFIPVHPIEKELPPPPPPKVELVPLPPPEKELPPPPPPKMELVPVFPLEKELPPPPPPPPKVELVPLPSPEKELPPPPPPKIELVPVPLPEKELPSPPPPPPPKIELIPVPPPEKELPPPPPPKIELVPVPLPEKELPPPPPPHHHKKEFIPVHPIEKELPPPPPPPPPKIELVPLPPPEKELPPPPPPKMELVPVFPPEKELPPPPPPKIEFVPVPPSEKELPPPPPPKVELVPVLPEKEFPPPPPPPKMELVPVFPPEKELPPPPPPPPPKVELVPLPPPEKELPPPPPPKMELVPVFPPEKELPPPPPPKIEFVPLPPPKKELPPPPPPVKLVPVSSSEQNEIPSHELNDGKPFADMPWPPHAPHPAHHYHPHHPPPHPPHHNHHHQPHRKEEDDDSPIYPPEIRALEEEKQLEGEKATTFQTTSADPTPPESSLSYPPFFMPNPTSQAPPPLTIPNSEPYSMIPSTTTFNTVPVSKKEDKVEDDEDVEEEEDCCSCESCAEDNESGVKSRRTSACQDLEQARRELKAIFDKIKKKLKCGRKTQRPTTIIT